jgi:WXG100 family type VII secretion target
MSTIRVTPHELRTLASKCSTEAKTVEQVKSTIASAVAGTDWESPAASRFKNDWNTKYVKALNELTHALEQLGQAANTMAANYDSTESAYKSS